MMFTGFAGYLVGYSSEPDLTSNTDGMVQLTTSVTKCPENIPPKYVPRKSPCPIVNSTNYRGGGSHKGFSLEGILNLTFQLTSTYTLQYFSHFDLSIILLPGRSFFFLIDCMISSI